MTMATPHTLGCGWYRCLPCDCPTGDQINRTHTRHISPYVPIVPIQGLERELAPVPNPMASFEDTTHAYECGYRDGIRAADGKSLKPLDPDMIVRETASPSDDGWVSELQFNDEAMLLIMRSLAGELHKFGLLSDLLSHSVDLDLCLDLGELSHELEDLVLVTPVSTTDAAPFRGINISFCPLGYRRLAEAAKDCVRNFIERKRGGVT